MKFFVKLFALFLMAAFFTSCGGQNQTNVPQDNCEIDSNKKGFKFNDLKPF
jgi:hypothetical protein